MEGCENKCMVDGVFAQDTFELAAQVDVKVADAYMCSDITVAVRALQIYAEGEYYYDYSEDEAPGAGGISHIGTHSVLWGQNLRGYPPYAMKELTVTCLLYLFISSKHQTYVDARSILT